MSPRNRSVDAITQAVVHNRTMSIVREMEVVTYRTARSPIVFAGRDFSCAVLDREGQLIACVTGLAIHILPMVFQARRILENHRATMRDGDVFMGNDPWEGNIHLNDVATFVPVFVDGDLVALTCIRMHWPDVGGMVPGSLSGNAREIYQEGLRIPLMRVGVGGVLQTDIMELITRNVRMADERLGDIAATVSGCQTGAMRLTSLMQRYGRQTILGTWDGILRASERRMRAFIKELPETTVVHEGYLDNDGVSLDLLRIRATVTVKSESILVDFTGSAPQTSGPMNVTLGPAESFAFMAVKAALDPKGAINSGCLRPIDVIAPEGSLLNARPPAACGGSGDVRYALNVAVSALSRLVPDKVSADDGSATTHHPVYLKDDLHSQGRQVVHYDMVGGGGGARQDRDGLDFVRNIGSGNAITPSVEVLEQRYPLRFTQHALRQDSGGPGRFRGGLGIIRERELLSDGVLSMLGDHAIAPLAGLDTGYAGGLARWEIVHDGRSRPVSPDYGNKVSAMPLEKGDRFRSGTTGGSGWGDPLERDLQLVLDDILDEKISMNAARKIYGVVFAVGSQSIDVVPTRRLRARLARARTFLVVQGRERPEFDRGGRVGWVGPEHSRTVERKRNRLAEVFRLGTRNPLRLRMHIEEDLPSDALVLDLGAVKDMQMHEGEQVLWRMIGD